MKTTLEKNICGGCHQEAVTKEARESLPKGLFETKFMTFRICADCLRLCQNAGAIKRQEPLVLQRRTLQWLHAVKGIQ